MVKRYEHEDKCGSEYQCGWYECSDGDYVDYKTYEELADENEKLKKQQNADMETIGRLLDEKKALAVEKRKLREALDIALLYIHRGSSVVQIEIEQTLKDKERQGIEERR